MSGHAGPGGAPRCEGRRWRRRRAEGIRWRRTTTTQLWAWPAMRVRDDLKKAYRKLAMQFHPDRNPGDKQAEARFKEANEAYEVLKDEQKRAAYDRFGHAAFENGGGGAGGFDFSQAGGPGRHLRPDVWRLHGPARRRRGRPRRPRRRRYPRQCRYRSLSEAFFGTKAQVKVQTRDQLRGLRGHRVGRQGPRRATPARPAAAWEGPRPAGLLPGRAHLPDLRRHRPRHPQPLPGLPWRRHGCRASARCRSPFPSGVEDGTRIRLSGEGEAAGAGGQPGDLYVHVSIRPHAIFQREGATILCRVPLAHFPGSPGRRNRSAGHRRQPRAK